MPYVNELNTSPQQIYEWCEHWISIGEFDVDFVNQQFDEEPDNVKLAVEFLNAITDKKVQENILFPNVVRAFKLLRRDYKALYEEMYENVVEEDEF
jgi:hypothetical protein